MSGQRQGYINLTLTKRQCEAIVNDLKVLRNLRLAGVRGGTVFSAPSDRAMRRIQTELEKDSTLKKLHGGEA